MPPPIDPRRTARFVIGVCLIGLLTLLMGGLTQSFLRGAVLGTVMSLATLGLLGLLTIRYSQHDPESKEEELLQFRISTLMILMALIAAYLGAMREFVTHLPNSDGKPTLWEVLGAGFLFGTGMFIAWLCVAESIMAYAARQPWLQRIVRGMFRQELQK